MKKCLLFIILFITIISNKNIYADLSLDCKSDILIDAESGRVLYGNNENKIIYPASLTKLLTALTVVEIGDLDDILVVDDDTPYEVDGSHIALEPGEKITLNDMLHGLLIASGNDVAEVISKNYSSYEGEFIELMNEKAKELGALNSNFVNPHGLHDDNHYTTAYDLSQIAKAAYENEVIKEIVGKTKYTIDTTNIKKEVRHLISTNKLLVGAGYGNQIIINNLWVNMKYEGATGMKTGYTPEAGICLIGSAERNGMALISVVIDGSTTEVYTDTHKLLNYGFDNFEKINLVASNEFIENIEIDSGDSKFLSLIASDKLDAVVKKDNVDSVNKSVSIMDYNLPVGEGDVLGNIEYAIQDEVIGSVPLAAAFKVDLIVIEETNLTLFALKTILYFVLAIILLIIILRLINKYRLYKVRKQKKYRR
ncbi:MAG: D-alanyl-D-alanine carboxypeptidase family protein [Bacillota bacterium]|nr:D-alanyl-D-alanine carboxypeptidase family protein [Bacillota bacterium]